MSTAEKIYDEVSSLPDPLAVEVLDFVSFLKQRYQGAATSTEDREWSTLQESSLKEVWDNDDDEVWNSVRAW